MSAWRPSPARRPTSAAARAAGPQGRAHRNPGQAAANGPLQRRQLAPDHCRRGEAPHQGRNPADREALRLRLQIPGQVRHDQRPGRAAAQGEEPAEAPADLGGQQGDRPHPQGRPAEPARPAQPDRAGPRLPRLLHLPGLRLRPEPGGDDDAGAQAQPASCARSTASCTPTPATSWPSSTA